MAAAIPIITAAAIGSSIVYTQKTAMDQQKQIRRSNKSAREDYDLKKQQAELALKEEQRKNINLLRQQQSAYRAKLGGSGLSARAGTGQATLNAMQREHDIEDKYLVNQGNISLDALLNSINQTTSRNLLALSSLSGKTTDSQIQNLSGLSSGLGRSLLK